MDTLKTTPPIKNAYDVLEERGYLKQRKAYGDDVKNFPVFFHLRHPVIPACTSRGWVRP